MSTGVRSKSGWFLTISALSIGIGSCVPPSSGSGSSVRSFAPSPGQPRLQNPEQVVIAPDGAEWPRPKPMRAPRYPPDARAAGLPGLVIVAFVIDTAGRVELPTVSIVKNATHPSFAYSVCTFLATARFEWPPHAAARGLVVMPFEFTITNVTEDVTVEPVPSSPREVGAQLREMTASELAAWIERQQHCG